MESRQQQLNVISKRIEEAHDKINQVLKYLNWDMNELQEWYSKQTSLVQCPINKKHFIPKDSLEEHSRFCHLKSLGKISTKKAFRHRSNKKPYSSVFFYKNSSSVLSFVENESIPDLPLISSERSQKELMELKEKERIVSEKRKEKPTPSESSRKPKHYRIKSQFNSPTEMQRELINAYMKEYF